MGVCSGGRRHQAGERSVRRGRHPAPQQFGAQRPLLHRDCRVGWVCIQKLQTLPPSISTHHILLGTYSRYTSLHKERSSPPGPKNEVNK